ncbi:glutathione S-transferase [Stachybotrys elegans]|uniref:glutathione transferase n=1 Tax=Stachybotrys elegans TaxID=80388 RepID=A0A8K0SPC0_9HYPO|nr:glutathione S-transferase [Stachybotrys elegans]
MSKPIIVWLSPPGPNPWKVIVVLEELGVPYEVKSIRFEDLKKAPFTDINPNGRVPAIQDPNTDLALWESGAIVQYLIKQYDTKNLLQYSDVKQQNLCNQWLTFQVSGQGPYYGQCTWFTYLHHEKLPSAIERYANEIKRVLGVLEGVLASKSEPQWLVGDRMTFADLAFVPWNDRLDAALGVPYDEKLDGFPHVKKWHERMTQRPSWVKAMELRAELMDEQGLDWDGKPKGIKRSQEL